MQFRWFRRPATWVAVLGLLAQAACAGGPKTLTSKDLVDPKPARAYRVFLRDGSARTLISLHREGEWLLGTERITVTETLGEGETARTNVTNQYQDVRLPMAEVERVEAEGSKGTDGSLFMAAGTIILGVVAFILLTQDSDPAPTDGGGVKNK
jgi:hypothetical protein